MQKVFGRFREDRYDNGNGRLVQIAAAGSSQQTIELCCHRYGRLAGI